MIKMQSFQEASGLAAFVCFALEYDRPFLAPLNAFCSRHAAEEVRPFPLFVLVAIQYPRDKLRERRGFQCALERRPWEEAWTVDVKSEGSDVGIGGWWPVRDERGEIRCKQLTVVRSPWAFRSDGRHFRLKASPEAMGLLLAAVAFGSMGNVSLVKASGTAPNVPRQPGKRALHQPTGDHKLLSVRHHHGVV